MGRQQLKKMMLIGMIFTSVMFVKHSITFANSSEPPAIIIIIENATDETQVSLINGNEEVEAQSTIEKVFEKQYAFYYQKDVWTWGPNTRLKVESGEQNLIYHLPSVTDLYRNIYTVDLSSGVLIEGVSTWRQILWTLRRVTSTIAIEGLVFLAFGYRRKRTLFVFLVMNLITQGYLNITLSGVNMGYYVLIAFTVLELLILVTELIIGVMAIREHTKWRTALCIFLGNALSLFVGGAMLMMLPA